MEGVKEKNWLSVAINLNADIAVSSTLLFDGDKEKIVAALSAVEPAVIIKLTSKLDYPFLSEIIQQYLQTKPIAVKKPFFNLNITINKTVLSGTDKGMIAGEAHFDGTHKGIIYFTGMPVLDGGNQKIIVGQFSYKLKTDSVVLNAGSWLLKGYIEKEIKKLSEIELPLLYAKLSNNLLPMLNKEWQKGITTSGTITAIDLEQLIVKQNELLLKLILKMKVQVMLPPLATL